jgi:hypothetical protein
MAYSLLKSYLDAGEAKEIRRSLLVMALPAIAKMHFRCCSEFRIQHFSVTTTGEL